MATYDVVLLIEQALTDLDVQQVTALHEAIEDPVRYHVLLPVTDAATTVAAGVGSLGMGDMTVSPASWEAAERVREEEHETAERDVASAESLFVAGGYEATSTLIEGEPLAPLAAKVAEVDAAEVIIMTRPHVIAEFFHVDWTSRARRKLNVPVLHLIEHENFDEQASGIQ